MSGLTAAWTSGGNLPSVLSMKCYHSPGYAKGDEPCEWDVFPGASLSLTSNKGVSMPRAFHRGIAVVLLLGFCSVSGCKKNDLSPTGPTGGTVTDLKANGAFAPVSRTEIQGTVFVFDQSGNPIRGLVTGNFSASLRFGPGISKTTSDTVKGTVSVESAEVSGDKVAVAMTLDYSNSMFAGDTVAGGRFRRVMAMEEGVKALVNVMHAGDLAEIIKFGTSVDFVFPFTSDKTMLSHAVDSSTEARGSTALFSSIYRGLMDAGAQPASSFSRAVVAFTDGMDRSNTITSSQVYAMSRQTGVPVYTIGLLDSLWHSTPPGLANEGERDLVEIADTTGGFYYYAPGPAQLEQIYAKIGGQLSSAMQMTILWPGGSLPPSGTQVQVVITVNYTGLATNFVKQYTMP
jgi:hypothetical protein